MSENETRVLVLDDDHDDAFLIEEAFDEVCGRKYAVSVFHTPNEALEVLKTQSFDAILCDYRLGAISGIDFLKAVRKMRIDTPVLLLTGMQSDAVDQEALAAGAADFIAKTELSGIVVDRAVRYAVANAARERLLRSVLDNASAGVVLLAKDGEPALWNPRYGVFASMLAGVEPDPDVPTARELVSALSRHTLNADTKDILVADHTLEKTVTPLERGEVLILLHDVTERVRALQERHEAQARVTHMAFHDTLTGLPNRAAFNNRLDDDVHEARRRHRLLAVLSIDLDSFKAINDLYGHAVGDAVLSATARQLKEAVGEGEFIARLGGDEFVAIAPISEDVEVPPLAMRLGEALERGVDLDGRHFSCGGSVGVAIYPHHGADREQLLNCADLAMYRSKRSGGGVCVFDSEMDNAVREIRRLSEDLKLAIEHKDIRVHFQPQTTVDTRELTGFEGLARWTLRDAPVSPGQFIPLAEKNGLIVPLGEHVLREACMAAVEWPFPAKVAVNLSPVQIARSDVANCVHTILLETGLPASRLELEVTETSLIEDRDRALHVLRHVKDLGVSVAMDDFGTGYSSLATLQAFPFDKIKLDRSFIAQVHEMHPSAAIVRAVVQLGLNLGMGVLAEGVETEEQVDFLKSVGCQEMQGYLIGRPAPEAVFPEKTAR
ncbi:MAG: EAL domain-containing protein, partial [Gammaproteobacteria bacterium]|nr:EAL domain-containing protein [Gammaproteobacteria bacterium]